MPTPFTSTVLRNDYIPTHPGKSDFVAVHTGAIVPMSEGEFGGFPLFPTFGGVHVLARYGDGAPYSTVDLTATTDANSAIAPGLNGLVFSLANATDDTTLTSKRTLLTAAGQLWLATGTVQTTDFANTAQLMGFVTSTTVDPLTTAPADGVYISHANAAATKSTVIENTNAAVASATLANATNSTFSRWTLKFFLGSAAAYSWGEAWIDGTRYGFTAAQNAALYKVVGTTAATLAFSIGQLSFGTNKASAAANFWAGVITGLPDGFTASIP